jgi:very-short-patch-repair endonuclease
MRMLVDLGAVDEPAVLGALEDVLSQRVASFGAVRAGLHRHARRGHTGIKALRDALAKWQFAEAVPDSELEIRMKALLTSCDLPAAEFHAHVCGFEVDFLVIGTCIVLECDGYQAHGVDRDQFEFDRVRSAELTAAGYVVVHFTWRQVTNAPDRVAARIEANLRRWAPDVLDAHRRRRRRAR